jgi:hypothetical protein
VSVSVGGKGLDFEQLAGRHVLVGVTVLDAKDEVVEQRQFHGVVEVADASSGIAVRRHDTSELEWLPPDLRAFSRAEPGEYRLRSTGEVLTDPDVLATWTVHQAPPDA